MATPIPFSVAPAVRSGTFQSTNLTLPAGYTQIDYQLTGLGSGPGSVYETAGIGYDCVLSFSADGGVTWQEEEEFSWQGGRVVLKNGQVDPTPECVLPLFNLPAGCLIRIVITLTGTFNVGLSGTLS